MMPSGSRVDLAAFVNSPERQASFRRGLSQFWISTDQMFSLARDGKEAQARALHRRIRSSRSRPA